MMLHVHNTAYLAAYLLSKAPNKSLDRLKLMKLLYLADRASLAKTGFSISFDKYVSMDNGPVLSETYDIIKAAAKNSPDTPQVWDELIATKGLTCALKDDTAEPIRMSKFMESVADHIWEQYGHKSGTELADFTHSLPEWQAPQGSSAPLRIKTILLHLGFSADDAAHYDDEHRSLRLEASYLNDPSC